MRRSSSGISPVVATVILVAIAIVIAIAVAFWASGLVGVFTRFEKIEITSAYFNPNAGTNGAVVLYVKNTGSSSATIDDIYVNGVPLNRATVTTSGGSCTTSGLTNAIARCSPGQNVTIQIDTYDGTNEWISGVTYEVAVHTASGKLYPASVLIP